MAKIAEPNPAYWDQYGPFQHVRSTSLIRCYLSGWYPKRNRGRVASYTSIRTPAAGGTKAEIPGFPVAALGDMLRHSYRDSMLSVSNSISCSSSETPRTSPRSKETLRLEPFRHVSMSRPVEGDAFARALSHSQ